MKTWYQAHLTDVNATDIDKMRPSFANVGTVTACGHCKIAETIKIVLSALVTSCSNQIRSETWADDLYYCTSPFTASVSAGASGSPSGARTPETVPLSAIHVNPVYTVV